jgi:hypothetical protein
MLNQHNVGQADNGDFTRSMTMLTQGPTVMTNWPSTDSGQWKDRFFNYWIPHWWLNWDIKNIPASSVFILWLPGAFLNYILYSKNILNLEWLSIMPKFLMLGFMLLLFWWVERQAKNHIHLLLGLGIPMTLIFTNTDYIAYFTSFYEETALFIYFFVTIIAILFIKHKPTIPRLAAGLLAVFLLASSKPSAMYWPLLLIPFIIYIWRAKTDVKPIKIASVGILISLALTIAAIAATGANPTLMESHRYNTLFCGALMFSNNPAHQLEMLGMADSIDGVGNNAYTAIGSQVINKHKQSFLNTVLVFIREPSIVLKEFLYAEHNMQVTFNELGKFSKEDPRSKNFSADTNYAYPWSLWSILKLNFFPRGLLLLISSILLIMWFRNELKKYGGMRNDLAFIGLLCITACLVDMLVVVITGGQGDMAKKLFLANILFDISLIALLNGLIIHDLEIPGRKIKVLSGAASKAEEKEELPVA